MPSTNFAWFILEYLHPFLLQYTMPKPLYNIEAYS